MTQSDTLQNEVILTQSTNRYAIDHYKRNMANYYGERTLLEYSIHITKFLEFCGKPYQSITRQDLKKWLSHNLRLGKNNKTISNYLVGIKSFYKYMLETGYTSCNPAETIRYPKIEVRLPKPLSDGELLRLMEIMGNNLRDRAILQLLYCTGVRASEAANIRISDISWKKHMILIRKAKCNKQRFVYFSELCEQMLQDYLSSRIDACEYLFRSKTGKGFSVQGFRAMIKRYVLKAGLNSRISTHWLRHSFAQQLINKGMEDQEVAKLLGHVGTRYVKVYSSYSLKLQKIKYDEFTPIP